MSIVEGSRHDGDLAIDADVVVVGSGAGGAVVAAELAEAGQSVVILEEGAHVPPERYGRMRPSENLRHLWRDAGLTFAIGLGDTPVINVMMGQCVGGSSVRWVMTVMMASGGRIAMDIRGMAPHRRPGAAGQDAW